MHLTDTTRGLTRFDRDAGPKWWNKEDRAVEATCFYRAVERQLIRLGHRPPDGLFERRLECRHPHPRGGTAVLEAEGFIGIHEPAMVRPGLAAAPSQLAHHEDHEVGSPLIRRDYAGV